MVGLGTWMKTCDGMSGEGQGGVEVRVKLALPLDTERAAQQAAKCECGVQGRVQAGGRSRDVDVFHITEIGRCPKLTAGQVKRYVLGSAVHVRQMCTAGVSASSPPPNDP